MEDKKVLLSVRDLEVQFHVRGRVLTAIRGINLDIYDPIDVLKTVGSVYDEDTFDREKYVDRGRGKNDKCRKCSLLPVCTDFAGCPTMTRDCFTETLAKEKRDIRSLETEDRLPPVKIIIKGKVLRVTEPTRDFIESNKKSLAPSYLKADETVGCEEASSILRELQRSEGSQELL